MLHFLELRERGVWNRAWHGGKALCFIRRKMSQYDTILLLWWCEWVKGEKIRAKMKRENLERLVFMQGDVVVTHAGVVDGKGGKTRTKEVDNGENWEQWVTTTASKLRQRWWVGIGEGGGRRRWWLRSKNWEHGLRPGIVFVRKWQDNRIENTFALINSEYIIHRLNFRPVRP